jgi:hypothetical protein
MFPNRYVFTAPFAAWYFLLIQLPIMAVLFVGIGIGGLNWLGKNMESPGAESYRVMQVKLAVEAKQHKVEEVLPPVPMCSYKGIAGAQVICPDWQWK